MDPPKASAGGSPRSFSPRTPEIAAEGRLLLPQKSSDEAKEGSALKKHAWNKQSNGSSSYADMDIGSVMGAVSWPALSGTPRVSEKPADLGKPLADGSSVSEAVVMPQSPQRAHSTENVNPAHNRAFVNGSRSFNRRGNAANGGTSFWGSESSPYNEQAHRDSSQKHHLNTESRGPNSQGQNGNDQLRNSHRRGNGQHPRAENPYHYGNRVNARPQDRSNYEWNQNGGYAGRDMHHQQRTGPRNFVHQPRPRPSSYINMPHGYGNHMGYPDMGTQIYYVPPAVTDHIPGSPYVPYAQPFVCFPQPDPQLPALLVRQIEYYFSAENLCKDIFLRKNMDEQGWVSISLIASFKMIKRLTNNIPFILDCLTGSSLVEIQGNKIRKRNDWKNWLLPNNLSPSSSNIDLASMSNINSLATQIRVFGMEESGVTPTGEVTAEVLGRSSSEVSRSFFYRGHVGTWCIQRQPSY